MSSSKAGIDYIVLGLKRTRNPDAVFFERLEHFLREMQKTGRTVLLCGVHPEVAGPMDSLGFQHWMHKDTVFLEEEELYSSTIKAVRKAYELMESNDCEHCSGETRLAIDDELYYLV